MFYGSCQEICSLTFVFCTWFWRHNYWNGSVVSAPVESKVCCLLNYKLKCRNCLVEACTLAFFQLCLIVQNWSELRDYVIDNKKDHKTWLPSSKFTGVEKR